MNLPELYAGMMILMSGWVSGFCVMDFRGFGILL